MQCRVIVGRDGRAAAEPGIAVTARQEDARVYGADVARFAAPYVEVADFHEQRGVEVDHVAFRFYVAVREADLVVRRPDELLAQPEVQLRVVEVPACREVGRVECPQHVGYFVFHDVAAVGEIPAAEIGLEFQGVARAENVGVRKPDHGAPFAVYACVDADRPAVARADDHIHTGRIERVGYDDHLGIGDVGARAQQLLVADDQLGIELVARLEQQVAPDNPFAGQHVGLVACALEPVAARVERHHALDGDVAYGFPGIRFQQPAFVQYAPVHRRIEYGFDEEHPVKHARDCAAVGFGLYAVVEALVALRGRRVQAVGGEPAGGDPVRRPHAGADRAGETDALRSEEGQHEYANPAIHIFKDNVFFDEKVRWNPLKCSLTLAGVTPGEKPNGAGYRYALPLRLTMHLLRQLSLRLL